MQFQLITLFGKKLDEKVYEVMLPTAAGDISVFPNHESLVSMIVPGVIAVRSDKNDPDDRLEYYATSGGVVEINQERVRALVDEADYSEDIITADAQAALDRALHMRENAKTQVELDEAHQLVSRHAVQLKVTELRRHRRKS